MLLVECLILLYVCMGRCFGGKIWRGGRIFCSAMGFATSPVWVSSYEFMSGFMSKPGKSKFYLTNDTLRLLVTIPRNYLDVLFLCIL